MSDIIASDTQKLWFSFVSTFVNIISKMESKVIFSEKGKKLLVVQEYKFCVANVLKDSTVRWRCVSKKTRCSATIYTSTEDYNTILKYKLDHNHGPEINLERQELSNRIKRKAQDDLYERPSKVIHKDLAQSSSLLDKVTTNDLNLIRKNVYEARKKLMPALPKNMDEVFQVLDSLQPKTCKNETFLLVNDSINKIVVFSCYTNLYFLCSVDTVYMDGTFNYSSKFFTQFFTIHGYKNGHYVPLIFCLLPNKNQSVYEMLFKILIDKCYEFSLLLHLKYIVIDFELAIHNAVKNTWQNVDIIGCRFHLCQSWFRKIQSLGLTRDYKENSEIGRVLKYFFGLQFLNPTEVADSFSFDLVSHLPVDPRLTKFCDYLVETYISEDSLFPPHIWSCLSSSLSRTTNSCESFHSNFNKQFYHSHPNIFNFVNVLLNFQTEVYIKINTSNKFCKVVRRDIKNKQQFVNSKILAYSENRIDRLTFVKMLAFKYAPTL